MKYQNIKVKKSLGQNFLIDKNIINKIIKIGSINKNKSILEIGPGSGNLTEKLVKLKVKDIIVVEKDKNLSLLLSKKFYNYNNFQVVNDDILKKIKFFEFKKNFIVYGNLPYNISTQILVLLATLNKWPPWYDSLIFMFQKEVADRILAKKNTNNYGRLAVLCNWRLDIKKHFDISKNCFFPKPKVNSTVLSFTPKKSIKFKINNPQNLEFITRIFFSNRRKMINKNFKKLFGNNINIIKNLNLNLNQRPGELSNEMYYKIVMNYEQLNN